MLLASDKDNIKLLGGLPKSWAKGHIKGLRARGGFEVDIYWSDGKLAKAVVKSLLGNTTKLRYADKTVTLKTKAGKSYTFDANLKRR